MQYIIHSASMNLVILAIMAYTRRRVAKHSKKKRFVGWFVFAMGYLGFSCSQVSTYIMLGMPAVPDMYFGVRDIVGMLFGIVMGNIVGHFVWHFYVQNSPEE